MLTAEIEGRRNFTRKLIVWFAIADTLFAGCVLLWVSNYLFSMELSKTNLWLLFVLTIITFSSSILLLVNIWSTRREIRVLEKQEKAEDR